MLVFLRHTGCTFCRATLADLALKRAYIESRGITLAFVHMSAPLQATELLQKYDLDDIHRFSDPKCLSTKHSDLGVADFGSYSAGTSLWRGLKVGSAARITALDRSRVMDFGWLARFILRNARSSCSFHAQTAADCPRLGKMAKPAVKSTVSTLAGNEAVAG